MADQPEYPRHVRWVRLVALAAVAAALDEIENVAMWSMLSGSGFPGTFELVVAMAAATLKFVLLLATLVGFLVSLVRAHNAFGASAETPPAAAD